MEDFFKKHQALVKIQDMLADLAALEMSSEARKLLEEIREVARDAVAN